MKTQVDKFKKEQALNNKIMLITILVFGGILFMAAGKNIGQEVILKSDFTTNTLETVSMHEEHTKKSEPVRYNYLVPLDATFSIEKEVAQPETAKLNQKVLNNNLATYKLALYALENEEEPELFLEEIMGRVNTQNESVIKENRNHFSSAINPYLNRLYKEKMDQIQAEIKMEESFKNRLATENERDLEMEVWMKADNIWKFSPRENENWNKGLKAMLHSKMKEVDKAIEADRMLKSYLILDAEEPLFVENWMINESNSTEYKVPKNNFLAALSERKMNETNEMIELICKTKCCGKLEIEEPLALENWMVSESCWCPDKRKTKHLYEESFALNTHK